MRLLKAAFLFAGACIAFTNRFFDLFKSIVPYILQMLLGWCLLFAAVYQIVQALREWIRTKNNRQGDISLHE